MKKMKDNFYDSYVIKVHTPDGTMFVCIVEGHDGEPFKISAHAGKAGTSFSVWAECVCSLIETMWLAGVATSTIVKSLTTSYTTRYATNDNGVKVYSGPQGIQNALMQYIQLRSEKRKQDELVIQDRR